MSRLLLLWMFLLSAAGLLAAQDTQVCGNVYSADDDGPLAGATVRLLGTGYACSTDVDGFFSLRGVPEQGGKLEVSFIGYDTREVAVKRGDVVRIELDLRSEMMDEVMVVAFGKQKRESFTGSASVVTAADIQRQQVTNPLQVLQGNVTGVQMTSGNSLTADPEITVRGIGSINAGNSPLIVLDGLPYNGYMYDINPADIASITVLKDAASNALYGARGANGVILITTKNAGRGETKVTAEARWGANHDARVRYNTIDNAGQYYEAHYAALRNYYVNSQGQSLLQAHVNANNLLGGPKSQGGLGYMVYSVPEGQTLIGWNGRLNPAATLGNRMAYNNNIYTLYPDNWTDEGLRTGLRQEYNLNFTGGNEKYSMYGSLGYLDNEGISYGSELKRFTARLKTEYQAYKWLRLGANASYSHSVSDDNTNVFYILDEVAPIYPLYVRDGQGNIMHDQHGPVYDYGTGQLAGCDRPTDNNGNYVQEDLLNVDRNVSNAFSIQGFAHFDFLDHFRLTVNGSTYVTENRMNTGTNPYYGYASSPSLGGSVTVGHYRTTDVNYQQLLNYNNTFGKNTLDVLVGHEYSRRTGTNLRAARSKVAMFDQNTELNGAIVNGDMSSWDTDYNVEGWFMRAQWDWDNRYFASASFRRDGSSNFHPSHRWGNFWSVGGAWIATKEPWMPRSWWLNMLKVKASYGEQGNDAIGNFRYTDTYSITNSDGKVAYVFSAKGNPDITWETVGSFNAGLEFELLGNRLRGGVEGYVRTTRDMLMWFATPQSLGYSGYYDNIGDMRNTGLELDLQGDIIATRNITWTVGLNLSWERNRVTYLPDEKKRYEVDGVHGYPDSYNFYGEGLPVNTWYLKRYAGVNLEPGADQGRALYYKNAPDGSLTTTTDYADADYYLCGDALPKVFGGFNTTLKAWGFDLTAQFNYSLGGKKLDWVYMNLMTPPANALTGSPWHSDILKAWSPENPGSDIPRWQYNDTYAASVSDRFLTDASSLTFKNVTLGYTLPKSVTRTLRMSRLRVYATAENIAYWTKRKGFDPRVDAIYGLYAGTYYPMRTISGGLTVEF